MSLPIEILPVAEAEIESACAWYERQRTGLGRDFRLEVDFLYGGCLL